MQECTRHPRNCMCWGMQTPANVGRTFYKLGKLITLKAGSFVLVTLSLTEIGEEGISLFSAPQKPQMATLVPAYLLT